jgi:hypothetical protein
MSRPFRYILVSVKLTRIRAWRVPRVHGLASSLGSPSHRPALIRRRGAPNPGALVGIEGVLRTRIPEAGNHGTRRWRHASPGSQGCGGPATRPRCRRSDTGLCQSRPVRPAAQAMWGIASAGSRWDAIGRLALGHGAISSQRKLHRVEPRRRTDSGTRTPLRWPDRRDGLKLRSNDPAIGCNQRPRFQPPL